MPNRQLRRKPGEAKRSRQPDSVSYKHTCYDCDWEQTGPERTSNGSIPAFEHAKLNDHHTEMIVTRYYYYEGKKA
jgi:hypothetical protein